MKQLEYKIDYISINIIKTKNGSCNLHLEQ